VGLGDEFVVREIESEREDVRKQLFELECWCGGSKRAGAVCFGMGTGTDVAGMSLGVQGTQDGRRHGINCGNPATAGSALYPGSRRKTPTRTDLLSSGLAMTAVEINPRNVARASGERADGVPGVGLVGAVGARPGIVQLDAALTLDDDDDDGGEHSAAIAYSNFSIALACECVSASTISRLYAE